MNKWSVPIEFDSEVGLILAFIIRYLSLPFFLPGRLELDDSIIIFVNRCDGHRQQFAKSTQRLLCDAA